MGRQRSRQRDNPVGKSSLKIEQERIKGEKKYDRRKNETNNRKIQEQERKEKRATRDKTEVRSEKAKERYVGEVIKCNKRRYKTVVANTR